MRWWYVGCPAAYPSANATRRYVQAHRDPCCGNPHHPIPEERLRAISGDEAGVFRIEAANRLYGVGNLVLYPLRDCLLGRQSDPSNLEIMRESSMARQPLGPPAATRLP